MMINIMSEKGESWSYDPDTQRLFRDGTVVPEITAIPVYSESGGPVPEFSGILIKTTGQILSLGGKYSTPINPESL